MVASIFPIWDVARRIAGDRVEVILALPPGRSAHGYDPSPRELARLAHSQLSLAVGLGLDPWIEQVLRAAGSGAKVVRVGEQVTTIPDAVPSIEDREHAPGGSRVAGSADPHVWMDPARMQTIVDVIASELSELDPDGQAAYARNARALRASLAALDARIAARARTWSRKTIVTLHGSMSYFAARYDLEVVAVVEPVAGMEPTAAHVAAVLDAIHRRHAAALFTEPQLASGPGHMIARDAGIPLGELDPVGGVGGRDSYEALLRWNADQLERLLR